MIRTDDSAFGVRRGRRRVEGGFRHCDNHLFCPSSVSCWLRYSHYEARRPLNHHEMEGIFPASVVVATAHTKGVRRTGRPALTVLSIADRQMLGDRAASRN